MVGHWDRDWAACDRYRSPHGFAQLSDHLTKIMDTPDIAQRGDLIRSEDSFNIWQSILRGAGVITGCRRCQDVCPVGADYEAMLGDVLEEIPEDTAEKGARLAQMAEQESGGALPDGYESQRRWIGDLPYLKNKS